MALSSVVVNLLRAAAPTLLMALGLPSPFNVIAAAVASTSLAPRLPAAAPAPVLSPEQLIKTVETQAQAPDFLLKLRAAEADLQKYEASAGMRFAELELQDRTRAGAFQRDSGMAAKVFTNGMRLVTLSLLSVLLVIGVSTYVVWNGITAANAGLATAGFGLVGTVVGFLTGLSSNIVSFYWGSSQGSKDKGDQIAQALQALGGQQGKTPAVAAGVQDDAVG
ncbi:hypothetical protein [Pseudomonas sp. dw_358]|uniref:hypothetical protein n=1 Tax=Pseudomonas sp. dw_358 TaxID=2720083 RepID=UPI001BD306D3|nr:hypothetical protein [Pseudomonas sp. dw_358]